MYEKEVVNILITCSRSTWETAYSLLFAHDLSLGSLNND